MLSYTLLHKHLMSLALFILLIRIIDIFFHLFYYIQKDPFFFFRNILLKLLMQHVDYFHGRGMSLLTLLCENYLLAAPVVVVRATYQIAFLFHELQYIRDG